MKLRIRFDNNEYNNFSDEVKKGAIYKLYYNYVRGSIYIKRESRYNKRYKLDREFLSYNK